MSAPNQPEQPQQTQTTISTIAQPDPAPSKPTPAFVHDPTFWIIIALACLFRVILERPTNHRK